MDTINDNNVAILEAELANQGLVVQNNKSIIQPKSLTFCSYSITAVQEDVMTYIMDELQKFAFNKPSSWHKDKFERFAIDLDCKMFPEYNRDTKRFKEDIDKLRKADFNFRWNPIYMDEGMVKVNYEEERMTVGNLFIAKTFNPKDDRFLTLTINPILLPLLLYYGKGVGGTKYFREIAFGLKSKFSKRIYKMVMDWQSLGPVKEISIEDFRDTLMITDSYTNSDIYRKIIQVAVKEINDSESKVKISNVEMFCANPVPGVKKQKADTIRFYLSGIDRMADLREENEEKVLTVLMQDIADKPMMPFCAPYAKCLHTCGMGKKVISKFNFYNDKVKKGTIQKEEYRNTMLKVLRESFGLDLRSQTHADNAEKAQKKKEARR